MKRIHRQISLENYRSRYCGLSDAFEGENYVAFRWEKESAPSKITNLTKNIFEVLWPQDIETNYDLFPCNIRYSGVTYSYPTLRDKYYRMKHWKDYNSLLESQYDAKVKVHDIDTSAWDGMDMDELKREYEANGGDDMFKFLSTLLFPSFEIPSKYIHAWGKQRLNLSEAMYWLGYFIRCNCNNQQDNVNCCDCAKCEELYCDEMIGLIGDWVSSLSSTTTQDYKYTDAYIDVRVALSTPIDDLGELTPLTEEWDGSEKYSISGNVVTHDSEVYCGENVTGGKNDCREILFPNDCNDNTQWVTYSKQISQSDSTNIYKVNNLNSSYTYVNDKLVMGPTSSNTIHYTFPLYENEGNGFYYIDNKLYQPKVVSSVTKDGNEYYLDQYDGEKKWGFKQGHRVIYGTIINNKFQYINDEIEPCPSESSLTIKTSVVLLYNGEYEKIDAKKRVTIKRNKLNILTTASTISDTYPKIDKYGYDNDGNLMFFSNKKLVYQELSSVTETNRTWVLAARNDREKLIKQRDWSKSYYAIENNVCHLYNPLTIYSGNTITSQTESKLSLFRLPLATDGMGNQLNGSYSSSVTSELILPYQSKTLGANAQLISSSETESTYWVDCLSSITLYLEDNVTHEVSSVKPYINTQSIRSHFTDISESQSVKCKFVYYMGGEATLNKSKKITSYKNGITYEETYTLRNASQVYCHNDYSSSTITYYEMISDAMKEINYGDTVVSVPLATIKYAPQMTKEKTFSNEAEFVSSPLMRQEYLLGISSKEKITGNIYIDRGMSQAFDKHLKLMEVRNLEALENYSNGYFKIQ